MSAMHTSLRCRLGKRNRWPNEKFTNVRKQVWGLTSSELHSQRGRKSCLYFVCSGMSLKLSSEVIEFDRDTVIDASTQGSWSFIYRRYNPIADTCRMHDFLHLSLCAELHSHPAVTPACLALVGNDKNSYAKRSDDIMHRLPRAPAREPPD